MPALPVHSHRRGRLNLKHKTEPRWWIRAYHEVAFDCFKTTSNAAEQENQRFKRRGIRSMNILDMLDAIVDLIYEIIPEMLNDARRRITLHGRDAVTVFAQKPTGSTGAFVARD